MSLSINSQYLPDLETIASIREGDKLGVRKGRLVIDRAGWTQGLVRTFKDIVYGGYNRDAVAEHCSTILSNLPKIPDDTLPSTILSHPDLILIDRLRAAFCKLSLTYYEGFSGSRPFWSLYDKTPFVMPTFSYDDLCKIDPSDITEDMLKDLTHTDMQNLVAHLNKQRVPTWKKIAAYALKFPLFPLLAVVATPIKWVIWNPLEYILRGRVTSNNPFMWYVDMLCLLDRECFTINRETGLGACAAHMIQGPMITKEQLHDFKLLAKDYFSSDCHSVKFSFLKIGKEATTRENFEELLRILYQEPACKEIQFFHLTMDGQLVASSSDKTFAGLLERHGFVFKEDINGFTIFHKKQ